MSVLRLAFRRETVAPVLALVFATMMCGFLVALRISWTGQVRYKFLLWNLFLAWIPLVFAFIAAHAWHRSQSAKNWQATLSGLGWILFFPNSSYILTDIIHLVGPLHRHFWVDLVLILTCAFTGLMVGFVSLFLMHSLVRRTVGGFLAWVFIAGAAILSGAGVYVGRFLRFNSWDVFVKPVTVLESVASWVSNPQAHPSAYFPLLFAAFLFLSYVMFYALTHLQHLAPQLAPQPAASAVRSTPADYASAV